MRDGPVYENREVGLYAENKMFASREDPIYHYSQAGE